MPKRILIIYFLAAICIIFSQFDITYIAKALEDSQIVNISAEVKDINSGYFSPAQVIINFIITDSTFSNGSNPNISANVTITNEGSVGYEYRYEWCVVSDVNTPCGLQNNIFDAQAAKFINPNNDYATNLIATVPNPGHYYFKLVAYFDTRQSTAVRSFILYDPNNLPGNGTTTTTVISGGGGGGGSYNAPVNPVISSCKGADLNGDNKVNSTDFSILLYFWKTKAPFKNACVDINHDNTVNSVDFSIMLSQWGSRGIPLKI